MRKFIEENNISFSVGERNTSVVILIGYAQHKELNQTDLVNELSKEIKKDSFIGEEVNRLWDYCKSKNYKKFWKTKGAKTLYKF
jgi:hypothetical protein